MKIETSYSKHDETRTAKVVAVVTHIPGVTQTEWIVRVANKAPSGFSGDWHVERRIVQAGRMEVRSSLDGLVGEGEASVAFAQIREALRSLACPSSLACFLTDKTRQTLGTGRYKRLFADGEPSDAPVPTIVKESA